MSEEGEGPVEILKKIMGAIVMKQQEMEEAESEEVQFTDMAGRAAIYVRGTVYAGNVIYIDNAEHVVPREIARIVFRARDGMVKMFQI